MNSRKWKVSAVTWLHKNLFKPGQKLCWYVSEVICPLHTWASPSNPRLTSANFLSRLFKFQASPRGGSRSQRKTSPVVQFVGWFSSSENAGVTNSLDAFFSPVALNGLICPNFGRGCASLFPWVLLVCQVISSSNLSPKQTDTDKSDNSKVVHCHSKSPLQFQMKYLRPLKAFPSLKSSKVNFEIISASKNWLSARVVRSLN